MMRRVFVPGLVAVVLGVSALPAAAVVNSSPETTTPTFNGEVSDSVYVGDTIYVGGTFTAVTDANGTVTRNRVAAISATTGELLAWNPRAAGAVYDLAALPDGSIAIGGTFAKVGGQDHKNIAVVDAVSGKPTSFNASIDAKVRALEVGPSGRLYVGGTFNTVNGSPRGRLAAFDGNVLSDWAPQANGDTPAVIALEAANGVIYVGGKFTTIDGVAKSGFLTSLDPSTGAVQEWNPPVSYLVNDVEANATTVFAAADGPGGHLRAQDANTGADKWDLTADGGFQAVTLMGDEVYFGGHFDNVCKTVLTGTHGACQDGNVPRHKMGMADQAGVLHPWAPVGNSALGVHSMENDGVKLAIGGTFTEINLEPRQGFALFNQAP